MGTTTTTVANRLSAIITKAHTDQAQAAIEAMVATEAMAATEAIAAMAATEAITATEVMGATTWYPPILYLNDCRTRHTIPTCLTSISSSVTVTELLLSDSNV